MKRRVSGIKPTGKMHLGNFFGAVKQYLDRQKEGENIYFVADYHALTTTPDREILSKDSLDITLDYLACGLDPKLSTIFLQSSLPSHTELSWILSNVTPVSLLNRAHAFKSFGKSDSVNSGLFTYPVLMAADILMYDADLVPVGIDQKQHVEIARDIAVKFNNIYGDTFKLPEAEILEEVNKVPGIDGQKMSKSYNNTIEIFGDEKKIKKQIFSIVTDSKGVEEPKDPKECNIFNILKLFVNDSEQKEIEDRYLHGIGYGELKKILLERFLEYFKSSRERRVDLSNNLDYVYTVLREGKEKAEAIALKKISNVRDRVGILKF